MVQDDEIIDWFKELGMKVERGKEGGFYFYINVSPPVGEAPAVAIIRPNSNAKYYIITMILEIDQSKLDNKIIKQISVELARMNVEVYMTPPDKPKRIQIAKLLFTDGLTKNELLNAVTLVKNASFLVYNLLYY